MQDTKEIAEFVRLSRALGENPAYVQGGGGNTSIKIAAGRMLVKASGTRLAEMTEANGYVTVDAARVAQILDEADGSENAFNGLICTLVQEDSPARPSMETGFHSVLGKVVAHTHSVYANVLTCSEEGPELAAKICPEAAWVPYCSPGLELSKAVAEAADCDAMILQNHGLIVWGDSVDGVQARHEEINQALRDALGLADDFEMHTPSEPISDIRKKVLFPDQVIVLGQGDALLKSRAADEVLAAWGYIYHEILRAGLTPHYLPMTEEGVLLSMDAEKNRQALTK